MKKNHLIIFIALSSITYADTPCVIDSTGRMVRYEGDILPGTGWDAETDCANFVVEESAPGTFEINNGILTVDNTSSNQRKSFGYDLNDDAVDEFAFSLSARSLDNSNPDSGGTFFLSWRVPEPGSLHLSTTIEFDQNGFTWSFDHGAHEESFLFSSSDFHTFTVYKESGSQQVNLLLNSIQVSSVMISDFTPDPSLAGVIFHNEENSLTEWDFVRVHFGDDALNQVMPVPEPKQAALILGLTMTVIVNLGRTRRADQRR